MTDFLAGVVCTALILIGIGGTAVNRAYRRWHGALTAAVRDRTVLIQTFREIIENDNRYAIEIADWGPDFTGEGDTLHRFRWAVRKANQPYVKGVVGLPVGAPEFDMVGNAATPIGALVEALAWIRKQGPVESVVVS